MKLFAKIVNSFSTLTISVKNSILDLWQGSGYGSKWEKHLKNNHGE